MLIKKNQPDATVCRYLFTAKSLYMFRVSQHPSSGVLKTVTANSGTGTATSLQRGLQAVIKIQPDVTVCRYLFTAKSLYMFRVSQNPSSGVLKTVTATSGTGHNTGTATSSNVACRPRREVAVPVPEVLFTLIDLVGNIFIVFQRELLSIYSLPNAYHINSRSDLFFVWC